MKSLTLELGNNDPDLPNTSKKARLKKIKLFAISDCTVEQNSNIFRRIQKYPAPNKIKLKIFGMLVIKDFWACKEVEIHDPE